MTAVGDDEWCFDEEAVAHHPTVCVGNVEYAVVACRYPSDDDSVTLDYIVRDADGNHRLIIFDIDGVVVVDKPYFLPNL